MEKNKKVLGILVLLLAIVIGVIVALVKINTSGPYGRYYEVSRWDGSLTTNYIEFRNGEMFTGNGVENDEGYRAIGCVGKFENHDGTLQIVTYEGECHVGYYDKAEDQVDLGEDGVFRKHK